jgi:peptide-methionine (R)-S-oxide reductase
MTRRKFLSGILGSWVIIAAGPVLAGMAGKAWGEAVSLRLYSAEKGDYIMSEKVIKSEAEWKKILSSEQFEILRKQGTERAFTGPYWDNKAKGIYKCAGCGNDLFSSDTKFKSGTGWPSYYEPIAPENVGVKDDYKFFMKRTEVHCARCEGHLGHIFEDGPPPTGLRYCINGHALTFEEA